MSGGYDRTLSTEQNGPAADAPETTAAEGGAATAALHSIPDEKAPLALDDQELDRLYSLPLTEFVSERNAWAKRLRQEGQSELAEQARALIKPTVSAWTINQLHRQRRDLMQELLAAIDRVRAAQLGALDGLEDAPSLSEAMRDEKETVAAIEEAAPGVLSEGGFVASQATVDRTMRSLRAAAADPEGRQSLEVGRLVRDFEPAGFASLAAGVDKAPPPPPRPDTRRTRDTIDIEMEEHRRRAALKREEQEERRKLDESRRAQEDERRAIQKKMDALRRTLESTREGERRLEREFHLAQRDLQEAERRLREAEGVAAQTETRLQETQAQRETHEAELATLRAELDALPALK